MFGNSKSLVPIIGTAVAKVSTSTAVSVVTAKSVPAPVNRGLLALVVSFPSPSIAPEDKQLLMECYVVAVKGFEQVVVEYALEWLLLHNPRNTPTSSQPPTVQDVHEMCKRVKGTWYLRCVDHFTEAKRWGRSFKWGEDNFDSLKEALDAFPWGPEPFQPGCYVPDDLVLSWMREWTSASYHQDALVGLPQAKFDALPADGFDDGVREHVIARRKQAAAYMRNEADGRL